MIMRFFFRLVILISGLLLFDNCSINRKICGETYTAKTKSRIARLKFDNDSICRFVNTFKCNDIDSKYKEITITCKYQKLDNLIILRNEKCKCDSCNFDFTIDIPPQESKKCFFLNDESRKVNFSIGPTYLNAYEKYGFIPNIDIDTVYIVKNKLIFIKQNSWRSIGFIFK
jgi:hypothetical protein